MQRIKLMLLCMLAPIYLVSAQNILAQAAQKLLSPDGSYEFVCYQRVGLDGGKQLYYKLTYKGKVVVEESKLGVLIENQTFESALAVPHDSCRVWGENLCFTDVQRSNTDETWIPVYGEHSRIRNNYNELTVRFQKGNTVLTTTTDGYDKNKCYYMNLIVRAYNEGVAFRYHFPQPANGLFLHITGEQTQFTMPEGTLAYYEPWAQGPFSLLPLKDWKGQSERPLTMKLTDGLTVAVTEAEMVNYARMKFSLSPDKDNTLQASIYGSVDAMPPYSTPWRVLMAAEKSIDLIAHKELLLNLNPDNQLKDVSWIKPGKVIRVSKLNQEDALKYIDFAAERNLQYIHLDAGWYGPEMKMESSALKVAETRNLNIPALVSYAASKGIGVWLYVNQRALYQQLDSILPLYRKWGVKGIKFGFVQVGNQQWTIWLHQAVMKCAQYGLMVDIHDEYRPTGFSRSYPNLLTQEGIRGNEEFPDADHNTILPFTRFLAGPADYTICYYSSKLKNTHAHQLALSVVYYSPLQFLYWYDNPSHYKGEPEVEFFDKVKTVWDDTQILNGEVGEYITVARSSGDDWYVGAITNTKEREVNVPTAFLMKGAKYRVRIFQDDDQVTTSTKVLVTDKNIKGGDVLKFKLKASGGVALLIQKR